MMQNIDSMLGAASTTGPVRSRAESILLWASLLPLLLLLHPYGGIVQDGRIYVGRGVADHDPAGVGRDMVFTDDAQTGFSLFRPIVRSLLDVLSARDASMVLALGGSLLWLGALIALVRRLTADPASAGRSNLKAAVVAVLALPSQYGAFATFGYAETVATPRIFAEAAVLAGLAALLGRRHLVGMASLALALAIHPLMALPGLAIAAVLLVSDDRRWSFPLAAVVAAALAAAVLKLPVAGRLFMPMDDTWWAILRQRCFYLFPTLWPSDVLGHVVPQAAAAILAGSMAPPRARLLVWSALAVALCGVAVAFAFGDLLHGLLVTQLQPWRALWLLAVLGNAGLVLAILGLYRRGSGGWIAAALLAMAWCSSEAPALAFALGAAATTLGVAVIRGALADLPRRVGWIAALAAGVVVTGAAVRDATALSELIHATSAQGGEMRWPLVLASGVASIPLVVGAVALALRGPSATGRPWRITAALAFALACGAAVLLWDGRGEGRKALEAGEGATALSAALGPGAGPVLWIDENAENWFLLGRPAFFNALQGAPILFSRDMALDWAGRGATLLSLGMARPSDLAPWAPASGRERDLTLHPDGVARLCADPRRPVGLVAPGSQLDAIPKGLTAVLWIPPRPIRSLSIDDDGEIRWRSITTFTVVRCAEPEGATIPSFR